MMLAHADAMLAAPARMPERAVRRHRVASRPVTRPSRRPARHCAFRNNRHGWSPHPHPRRDGFPNRQELPMLHTQLNNCNTVFGYCDR